MALDSIKRSPYAYASHRGQRPKTNTIHLSLDLQLPIPSPALGPTHAHHNGPPERAVFPPREKGYRAALSDTPLQNKHITGLVARRPRILLWV